MSDLERMPTLPPTEPADANSQERETLLEGGRSSKTSQSSHKRSRSPQDTEERSRSASHRSRSPPKPDRQERSQSPREDRQQKKQRRKDAGFKWKDKRRDDDQSRDEGLRRGYRDQNSTRRRSRSRSRSRDRPSHGDRERRNRHRSRSRSRSPRRGDSFRTSRDERRDRDRGEYKSDRKDRSRRDDRPSKPKAEKPPAPAAPQQEFILVTVNDRLGTKKQIPCSPNDTIKDFKAVVAMMIGRRTHEILLKRQSERPFKDFLTLQDYGVSNGASLDLEVDTGD